LRVEGLGDDQVEDAVAEEFQTLVVASAGAAVGEGRVQEGGVGEGVSEAFFQGMAHGVEVAGRRTRSSKRATRLRLPLRGGSAW